MELHASYHLPEANFESLPLFGNAHGGHLAHGHGAPHGSDHSHFLEDFKPSQMNHLETYSETTNPSEGSFQAAGSPTLLHHMRHQNMGHPEMHHMQMMQAQHHSHGGSPTRSAHSSGQQENNLLPREEQLIRNVIRVEPQLLISMPVKELNALLAKCKLQKPDIKVIKAMRRRFKNKCAAQNCRKRKMVTFQTVKQENDKLRKRIAELERQLAEARRSK
eukprot:Clim_evm8s28 gene=Clim_evmTU8s28